LSSRRGPQWRYDPIVLKRLLAGWRRPADDLPPLHPRLESYRAEVDRFDGYIHDTPIRQLAGGRAILALPREEQVVILLQSFAVMRLLSKESRWRFRFRVLDDGLMAVSRKRGGLRILAMALLRRRLPFSEAQILQLADEACGEHIDSFYNLPLGGLVRAFESYAREAPLPEEIRPLLAEFVRRLRDRGGLAEWRRLAGRLEALLAEDGDDAPAVPLGRGDAWADRLLDGIEELPAGEQAAWRDLLAHARTAGTAMPARAWSERAQTLLESDVQRAFPALLRDVLDALGQPGSGPSRTEDPRLLDDRYTDLLRGLVWCVGLHGDETRVGQLVGAAGRCFKKVRSAGPLNVKVGNACLWALGAVPGPAAVAALGTLRGRVRHASTRAQIDKALAAAAKRLGMDEKEVAEAAVPDFGMVEVGCLRRAVGEFEAVLRLTHSTRVETRWLKPDGREQKTAPKPVREAYPDEVDAVRSLVREIKAVLPGQRDRLERLLLERREWPRELWRERYLDHPLVGSLVRRLIWTFRREDGEATAIWHDGALTRLDGTPLGGAYDNARVSLWHPLEAGEETIRGWRLWLYDHQTTQPFKQAHREIYLLTDAERDTVTYSNRFAAHILKQHQFAALCQQRGWRYTLQGAWDSGGGPPAARTGATPGLLRDDARCRPLRRGRQRRQRPTLAGPWRGALQRLLAAVLLRRPGRGRAHPQGGAGKHRASARHRRPLLLQRPLPGGPGQTGHLQDPLRQRQRAAGGQRAVPVHRARPLEPRQGRAPLPALRGRRRARHRPEQGFPAGGRRPHRGPVDPGPDPALTSPRRSHPSRSGWRAEESKPSVRSPCRTRLCNPGPHDASADREAVRQARGRTCAHRELCRFDLHSPPLLMHDSTVV
jgi:hypothetical protein